MAKWNRRRVSAMAGALVLAIWIPVALAQNYFRYNAWILPITGLLAVLFYGILAVTAPTVSAKIHGFHHGFGASNPLSYLAITATMGGILILLLGGVEWYAIRKSLEHVAALRKADALKPTPTVGSQSAPVTQSLPTGSNNSAPNTKTTMRQAKKGPKTTEFPTPSSPVIVSAPNGIAVGGGIVTNPTVNNTTINQGLPSRRIRDQDRPALIQALSSHVAKVTVYALVNDNEGSRLANDIYEVLEKAGWNMHGEPVRYLLSIGPVEEGILFKIHGESVKPGEMFYTPNNEPLAVLGNILSKLNLLPIHAQRYPDLAEGEIQIQVGPQARQ